MYNIITTIQYISILGLFIESIIVFRRWKSPLHSCFFLICMATLVNNIGYLLQFEARSEEAFLTALRLSYAGRIWIALFWFFFIAGLCGKKLSAAVRFFLTFVEAGIYASILTLPEHDLFYTEYEFSAVGGLPHFSHGNGICHHIFTVFQLFYITDALVMLFGALRKKKSPTAKKRIVTVILAVIVQSVFYIVQISKIFSEFTDIYDITMTGFTIGTVFMFVAIFRFDLLGTSEIAREMMIDRLSEGIIAADSSGIVRYFNEHAKILYPALQLSAGNVPSEITDALANHENITIDGHIYAPEENDLIHGGENFGKLYALVDETEHFQYMQALEEQKQVADSANQAKSAFLANMSHDIRTPINAVLGMNEMILRECDDENILGYSEKIRGAGNTLLGLINDVLDFSKIEAGKLDIIPVEYDLTSVLNDLVNMIKLRADAKNLRLETKIDENIPKLLFGDEIRLKQIITNILTNAVKYTEKGSVTFSVGYEDEENDSESIILKVSIADTGIGIKQEDIPKLFSSFDRIEEERNRNIEGTGLGMNITMQLLSMMNSSLNVESEYGKGSVFSFSVVQKAISREPVGNFDEALRRSAGNREKYSESFTAPDAEILVTDDTPMNLEVFKSLLKKTLVRIDTASGGDECISLASKKKYDMIFLDHMMPGKDGIETLGELKAMRDIPNSDTPVICLTANAVSGSRERYLEAGFDDHLTKPVDPQKLEQLIKNYLPKEKIMNRSSENNSCVTHGRSAVLVIDDDEIIRRTAENILKPHYDVICCDNGDGGIELAAEKAPDLVLLDIQLVGMTGFDVLDKLKHNERTKDIPVMFVTGNGSEETEVKGFRCGASDFVKKPFVPEVLLQRTRRVIELYHYQSGLKREVGRQTERADKLSLEMMTALSKTVDAKDHYTNGHSGRVAEYSAEIARRMGKSRAEQQKIYEMGLMHDIGKIGVSEEIINKTSRLTDDEFAQIKKHTTIGYDILSSITEMPEHASGARSHHEKYNGTGYPDGLKGRDIPEAARIICVADCYDAMTSTRTYSTPKSQAAVRAEFVRCSGTQFDPDIAAVMIQMIDDDKDYKMNEQGGAKVWKTETDLEDDLPESENISLPDFLNDISEIDTARGLAHCGGAEAYLSALGLYSETAASNADEIAGLLKNGDIRNATVKIHALKSTSRVIGAADLGDLAEKLEAAGNAGDAETLSAHSGELLGRYGKLGEALSPLLEKNDLPPISESELEEAFTLVREFLSVEDYESAVQIIKELDGYSYPESKKSLCEALKKASLEFDYSKMNDIMSEGY